jgi:hypothetical protein
LIKVAFDGLIVAAKSVGGWITWLGDKLLSLGGKINGMLAEFNLPQFKMPDFHARKEQVAWADEVLKESGTGMGTGLERSPTASTLQPRKASGSDSMSKLG